MDQQRQWAQVLAQFRSGELDLAAAVAALQGMQIAPLGHTVVDHARMHRCGVPEAVFAAGKTPAQTAAIARSIRDHLGFCLVTRTNPEHVAALTDAFAADAHVAPRGRTVLIGPLPEPTPGLVAVPIVTAGTSDEAVAEEAEWTCMALCQPSLRISDVGVAGLHRLGDHLTTLRQAHAVICIAGMEGALPSVLGGLLPGTVIGVPTSVGYGAALGGFTALMGMLTSCAAGVVVVNIDNGFGAAIAAARIHRAVCRGAEA